MFRAFKALRKSSGIDSKGSAPSPPSPIAPFAFATRVQGDG